MDLGSSLIDPSSSEEREIWIVLLAELLLKLVKWLLGDGGQSILSSDPADKLLLEGSRASDEVNNVETRGAEQERETNDGATVVEEIRFLDNSISEIGSCKGDDETVRVA